jgi:hypothetical protein
MIAHKSSTTLEITMPFTEMRVLTITQKMSLVKRGPVDLPRPIFRAEYARPKSPLEDDYQYESFKWSFLGDYETMEEAIEACAQTAYTTARGELEIAAGCYPD